MSQIPPTAAGINKAIVAPSLVPRLSPHPDVNVFIFQQHHFPKFQLSSEHAYTLATTVAAEILEGHLHSMIEFIQQQTSLLSLMTITATAKIASKCK